MGDQANVLLTLLVQAARLVFCAGLGGAQLKLEQVWAGGVLKVLLKGSDQLLGNRIDPFSRILGGGAAFNHADGHDRPV